MKSRACSTRLLISLTLVLVGLLNADSWAAEPTKPEESPVEQAQELADGLRRYYQATGKEDVKVYVLGIEVWVEQDGKKRRVHGPPVLKAGDPLPKLEIAGWLNTEAAKAADEVAPADSKPAAPPTLAGKVVYVDFSATWCGPCRASLPHVQQLYTKYAKDGLEVVVVTNETKADFEAWAGEQKIKMPTAVGVTKACLGVFGVEGWPSGFVFDHHGKFVSRVSPQDVRLETQLKMRLYARNTELNKLAMAGEPKLPVAHLDPDVRLRKLQAYLDVEAEGRYTVVHGDGESGAEFDLREKGETDQGGYISHCRIPTDPAPELKATAWFNTESPETPPDAAGKVRLIFFGTSTGKFFSHMEPLQDRYADKGLQTIVLCHDPSSEFLAKCKVPLGTPFSSGDHAIAESWGIFGRPCIALVDRDGKIAHIAYLVPPDYGWSKAPMWMSPDEIEQCIQRLLDKRS